ncbi:MAG TPA: VanZ family protein [Bacillota bacterium]
MGPVDAPAAAFVRWGVRGSTSGKRWALAFALSIYLAVVLRYVLFKVPGTWQVVFGGIERTPLVLRLQGSNFVPFKTILHYLSANAGMGTALRNVLGNIALFVPLGILLPLVFTERRPVGTVAGVALGVSLVLEVVQLSTGVGSFDVDDLMLNVLGGVLGALMNRAVRRCHTRELAERFRSRRRRRGASPW